MVQTNQRVRRKMTLEKIIYKDHLNGFFIATTTNGTTVQANAIYPPPIGEEFFALASETKKQARNGGIVWELNKIFLTTDRSISLTLLSGNIITGIRGGKAENAYELYGEELWDILTAAVEAPEKPFRSHVTGEERTPIELLVLINGVGKHVANQMVGSWSVVRKHFLTARLCVKCSLNKQQFSSIVESLSYEMFLDILNRNAYLLSTFDGMQWEDVDLIASLNWEGKVAIEHDSPIRIAAAFREVVRKAGEEGHTALPIEDALDKMVQLAKPTNKQVVLDVLRDDPGKTQLVVSKGLVSTMKLYNDALEIWNGLNDTLQDVKCVKFPIGINPQDFCDFPLAEKQAQAVEGAMRNNVFIVTGGPGVGKTTAFLSTLLKICKKNNISYVLAAPTGAASVRITASTGEFAETIHSTFNIFDKINCPGTDLIVFDEASMIDEGLLAKVIKACRESYSHPRIVLIGDPDQLPPVGAGFPLVDLLNSSIPSVKLDKVYRTNKNNILEAAHAINAKVMPTSFGEDYKHITSTRRTMVEDVMKIVVEMLKKYTIDEIQILTPLNRDRKELNAAMKMFLNGSEPVIKPFDYSKDDKVIQTKNNRFIGRMNGEIGKVKRFDYDTIKLAVDGIGEAEEAIEITFPDYRKYPKVGSDNIIYDYKTASTQVQLAYALTVHKAQGNQFKCVIVVMSPVARESFKLKQIPYTALTRASEVARMVDVDNGMRQFVQGTAEIKRYSFLTELTKKEG